LHPNVTVLLDQDAASLLQRRDYYDQMERIQMELESAAN
jgi:hypothetical protein